MAGGLHWGGPRRGRAGGAVRVVAVDGVDDADDECVEPDGGRRGMDRAGRRGLLLLALRRRRQVLPPGAAPLGRGLAMAHAEEDEGGRRQVQLRDVARTSAALLRGRRPPVPDADLLRLLAALLAAGHPQAVDELPGPRPRGGHSRLDRRRRMALSPPAPQRPLPLLPRPQGRPGNRPARGPAGAREGTHPRLRTTPRGSESRPRRREEENNNDSTTKRRYLHHRRRPQRRRLG
mmetsp:Transcript_6109/g.19935  ORF Transcript_6109/g.19935 Transcript_6109/m.19935 type:complete len:234 (+) Transcript_6109:83-784(+)